MWIFAQHGFLSIVEDNADPNMLLIRGRVAGDIEAYFPGATVLDSAGSDYRYRARILRKEVIIVVARMAYDLSYSNFKSAISDHRRSPWYLKVWDTMAEMQDVLN